LPVLVAATCSDVDVPVAGLGHIGDDDVLIEPGQWFPGLSFIEGTPYTAGNATDPHFIPASFEDHDRAGPTSLIDRAFTTPIKIELPPLRVREILDGSAGTPYHIRGRTFSKVLVVFQGPVVTTGLTIGGKLFTGFVKLFPFSQCTGQEHLSDQEKEQSGGSKDEDGSTGLHRSDFGENERRQLYEKCH
jgi:hypothetical protein